MYFLKYYFKNKYFDQKIKILREVSHIYILSSLQ